MAIRTLRLNEEWEYRSKYDPDGETENATVFRLGTLSARIFARLQDDSTSFRKLDDGGEDDVEAKFMPNTTAYEVVRYGLRGVTNLQDDEGNAVEFMTVKKNIAGTEVQAVSEKVLRGIHLDVVRELAEQIQERNTLTEVEAKNSDG